MRFHIEHETRHRYSAPVFIEPHCLRVQPRSEPAQRADRFRLEISPEPQARSEYLDVEGNNVCGVWFTGTASSLDIRVTIEATTLRTNPFDFLPGPEGESLPIDYRPEELAFLAPYLNRAAGAAAVEGFARTVAADTHGLTSAFLAGLVKAVYGEIRYVRRKDGPPLPPQTTLSTREGTCRDTTVLFMEACRAMGIAARFVSGYQEGSPEQEERELHAWAEVYIPGGGWRGYDPTHGLAVADRHLAVASSATAAGAAPVTGSFRKSGVTATMESRLDIRVEPDPV